MANYGGNESSNPSENLVPYKGNSIRYTRFKKFINTNGLIDIGPLGIPFTWCNKREESNAIFARLDRALMNCRCLNRTLKLSETMFQL